MNLRIDPGNPISTLLSILVVLDVHVSDAVEYNSKISLVMQQDLMMSLYSRRASPWIIQA